MKLFITNRKKQRISILADKADNQIGLAFVMHGLGGFKEQPHIQAFAESFLGLGFTVIRFDTTNTLGESDGDYQDATTTNYYEDLEDVIQWASKQGWYQEPFFLAGHSLGGISTALFAENYPGRVKALAPISTVVSGKLFLDNLPKKDLDEWERTGFKAAASRSKPGIVKKLKWHQFKNDILKYDLLEEVSALKMPVLLIVGDKDTGTPIEHQQIFYDALPAEKEMHVIRDAQHTFRGETQLKQISGILTKWIHRNI